MKTRQVASLALKLIAVFLLLQTMPSFLGSACSLWRLWKDRAEQGAALSPFILTAAAMLLMLAVLAALFFKSDAAARRLIPEAEDVEMGGAGDGDAWFPAALAAIGAWAVVIALSRLAGFLVSWRQWSGETGRVPASVVAGLATWSTQLILGAALFLQARGVAGLWRKLRGPDAPE